MCFLQRFKGSDYTYTFIDGVVKCFSKAKYITVKDGITVCVYDGEKYLFDESVKELTPKEEIEKVCKEFSLPSDKYCKPSIGETTRVLLRRTPWKILVNEKDGEESEELRLLLELAREKEIPVEQYPLQNYKAIGLIKVLH